MQVPISNRGLSEPMKQFRCPNGLRIWNSPAARRETHFLCREIFEKRCYEKHGVRIHDRDVVLDIGSNVGIFALSLMERFRNLQIYCFEPVPGTRSCLVRNIGESPWRIGHDVTILDLALGATDTEAKIEYFSRAPGNSTLFSADKLHEFRDIMEAIRFPDLWRARKKLGLLVPLLYPFRHVIQRRLEHLLSNSELIPCKVRTLSNVIRNQQVERIDLLKIDVEGSEIDVLKGIDDRDWPLIRQISMEVHSATKPHLVDLMAQLRALGFARIATESMLSLECNFSDAVPCMLYAVRE